MDVKPSRSFERSAEDHASTIIDLEENKLWTADQDTLSFKYSLTPEIELNKRNIIKKPATIYDHLGFLAPYIVRAKIFIQKAWVEAAGWDVTLPVRHQEKCR